MKTLQEGDKGRREADFYRKIFTEQTLTGADEEAVLLLRDLVPKFYGIVQVKGRCLVGYGAVPKLISSCCCCCCCCWFFSSAEITPMLLLFSSAEIAAFVVVAAALH